MSLQSAQGATSFSQSAQRFDKPQENSSAAVRQAGILCFKETQEVQPTQCKPWDPIYASPLWRNATQGATNLFSQSVSVRYKESLRGPANPMQAPGPNACPALVRTSTYSHPL
jgi:hypothetical protein